MNTVPLSNFQNRRVRHLLSTILFSALLFSTVAPALFASGGRETGRPSITVIGEGEVLAKPDQATLRVGVQLYNESAEAATAELRERMDRVIAAILETGVPREQIQTTNYSLFFERDYRGPESAGTTGADGAPEGLYRVQNMVEVLIDEVDAAATVVEAAVDAGANQMHGLAFSFSDPGALDSEARAAAMGDARSRAEELAGAAGREVGEVLEITQLIGSSSPPQPRLAYAEGLGAGGPIEPGRSRYAARIQVTYRLR